MQINSFETVNTLANKYKISLFLADGAIMCYQEYKNKRFLSPKFHSAIQKSGFVGEPQDMSFDFYSSKVIPLLLCEQKEY
jgi:hypothetical protein